MKCTFLISLMRINAIWLLKIQHSISLSKSSQKFYKPLKTCLILKSGVITTLFRSQVSSRENSISHLTPSFIEPWGSSLIPGTQVRARKSLIKHPNNFLDSHPLLKRDRTKAYGLSEGWLQSFSQKGCRNKYLWRA